MMIRLLKAIRISTRFILAMTIIFSTLTAMSIERPSNTEIFYRCFAQLTQSRAKYSDPLTAAVREGSIDPVEACVQVLEKAQFGTGETRLVALPPSEEPPLATTLESSGTVKNISMQTRKNILRTFHNLHASWFSNKNFSNISTTSNLFGLLDFHESSQPALYFTGAFFSQDREFTDIVLGQQNLEADREDNAPALGPATFRAPASTIYTPVLFAAKGDLLGFRVTANQNMDFDDGGTPATTDKATHFGAGILGSITYFLQNLQENKNYRSNGGVKMFRKWSKAVFNDLLCRDLPVARESDVLEFVVPTSSIPFRQSKSCVVCHASMDRMAATIRNIEIESPDENGVDHYSVNAVTLTAEANWPSTTDGNYYKRPPNGVLFFRNHRGDLINESVTSLGDLGTRLSQQEDLYICAAKRYYSYLTGVDVKISDIGSPDQLPLSALDQRHRDQVVALGLSLMSHKDPMKTVTEILRLPQYRQADFGKISIQEF